MAACPGARRGRATRRRRIVRVLISTGVVLASVAGGLPSAASAATPPGPVVVQPTGMFGLFEVSDTGQWLFGIPDTADYTTPVVVDRATGAAAGQLGVEAFRITGFVRDNPNLRLEVDSTVPGIEFSALWLHDLGTGARLRVDTDSAGMPLFPVWTGPQGTTQPRIAVSPKSVSRDGVYVAMCLDDVATRIPRLSVKNLVTGELKATGARCGVGASGIVRLPEMSFDGSVVHLNGSVDDIATEKKPYPAYLRADRLVFPLGRKVTVRRVQGWGSMTRDGRTLFMIRGTRAPGARRPAGLVGAYSVRTGRTKALPGRWAIYGNNVIANFSAFDKASVDGRYVVYGNKVKVIDRKKGRKVNVGTLMTAAGYPPSEYVQTRISGDGLVVFGLTTTGASVKFGRVYVAVSGWR